MNLMMLLEMASSGFGDRVAVQNGDAALTYSGLFRAAGVAAAEVAIGLAILVCFFRNRGTIDVEDVNVMKG